jgi:hypothetical protein
MPKRDGAINFLALEILLIIFPRRNIRLLSALPWVGIAMGNPSVPLFMAAAALL